MVLEIPELACRRNDGVATLNKAKRRRILWTNTPTTRIALQLSFSRWTCVEGKSRPHYAATFGNFKLNLVRPLAGIYLRIRKRFELVPTANLRVLFEIDSTLTHA